MKWLNLIFFALFSLSSVAADRDSLLVVFWNMENFFDYTDSGAGESDKEFSSMGKRRWTRKRFYAKCDAAAKSIFWMGEKYGRMPDIIGLAEIENRRVLAKMLDSTLLRKYDYRIVHYDSGDSRGIDVALLYRSSSFRYISSSLKTPVYEGKKMNTRDILHVRMAGNYGKEMNFIVNHHPSKYGGSKSSEAKRNAAMTALSELCDSIGKVSDGPCIAMGDFNDTPDSPPFDIIREKLSDKGSELHMKGEGTIRYEGRWELIDMFLVSPEIADETVMEVCRIPFLMTWERKHPGEKPLRTYSGPKYLGGVSDHCPVILWYFKANTYL